MPDEDGGQGAVAVLESDGQPVNAVVSQSQQPDHARAAERQGARGRRKGAEAEGDDAAGGNAAAAAQLHALFSPGNHRLHPPSRAVLPALRAEIASRPGADVEVTGHTDTVGGEADNDLLSRKRAEEVLAVLSAQGIDRSLMTAVGRGERELREATADGVSNAANRRVEVIVR